MGDEDVVQMPVNILLVSLLIMCAGTTTWAQKQLVILKRDAVVKRYYPGDDFVFKRKGTDGVISSYINNLSDTAVVTHRDTIPFHEIERVYFMQHSFRNTLGAFFVIGGAGYFLVDQINNVLVNGNSAALDSDINKVSVPLLAAGLPMMLIKKRSQAIRRKYRLLTADSDSPFYRPEIRSQY